MRKKIKTFALIIIGIICTTILYSYANENNGKKIQAANSLFPTMNIQQYAKLQLNANETYTALNTTGNFLADKNSTTSPVDFHTEISTIVDTRNSSFIATTRMPTAQDIQPVVSSDQLNTKIPSTNAWWVNDIVKKYNIDSSQVVNQYNQLNGETYTHPDHSFLKWTGHMPIESEGNYQDSLFKANDPDALLNTITGKYDVYSHGMPFEVKLCHVIVEDNNILPCDSRPENQTTQFSWPSGAGHWMAVATLDFNTKTVHLTQSRDYSPGDIVFIADLNWTSGDHPAGGSMMIIAEDAPITIQRGYLFRDQVASDFAGYKGALMVDFTVPIYQANLRPLIQITTNELVYASKKGESITTNQFKAVNSTMQDGQIYIPHVNDQSLNITDLRENESGNVLIDAENRTIKIPKGTSTITLPVNTSVINSGYDRYISISTNNNGQVIYGKIDKVTSEQATLTLDLSSLMNVNASGTSKSIQLYAEDINLNGTSYISQPYDVNLQIIEPFRIEVDAKTNLVYSQNVNQGDTIATYMGYNEVTTMTYSLISDTSVPGHENDYRLFTLSNGNIQVNSSNGLNAGDYYFKVQATNGNDPTSATKSATVHIRVSKIDVKVAFQNPNQTKKTIPEASSNWSELATATPSQGNKITYTKVGGDIGLIDLDKDSGTITYRGNNIFGKVKIRATADDDPSTNNDNYNSAYAEKEIVIVREVDATIIPDPASGDANIPTFSMDKANIKTGGTIGKIQGMLGTPDTIGGSVTTYRYELKNSEDGSMFRVNSNTGVITSGVNLAVGTYHFTITVSDKWSSKDIPVTVNVGMAPSENLKFYENVHSNTMITQKSAKITDNNITVYATVKGSSNNNPVIYRLKDGESTNVIDVNPNSGAITIKNVGTVVIIAEKQGGSGQANAIAELTFTVTAGTQEFIYVDESGNELAKLLDKYKSYEEVYGKDKVFQLHTAGNPPGSTVNYTLKNGSPSDVITVDLDGTIHILHASLNTQKGKVIVLATSHDPSGNYTDKTIELPIDISKADQIISFADITHAPNGQGSVTPIINEQDLSSSAGGAIVDDPDYYISVGSSANGIAWTNNGVDIQYNYEKEEGIVIPLHVEKAGNRDYNKAEADGTMKILGKDESTLAINSPGKIVYGDHFTIRSLQDDSSGTNVQYTFEVNNTIYISQPNMSGNKAEFDALKNSGNTEIQIKITRTADGEVPLSKTIKVKVLPKDINIVIDDKAKKQGEDNPELTFQDFTNQLVSWNGVQDVIDLNDVILSTTATTNSKGGSYPIVGNPKTMNGKYSNYNFIFKDGKLMVEGMIDKDVDEDGKPDFNDPDGDDCPDLNIKWKDDDGNWVIINGDRDYDGIPDLNIDSDGDGVPDLNIDTDNDGKPDINLVILKKTDWKPTKCVVQSTIVKEEYCTGTKIKPQINVDTDNDNIPNINIDTNGDMKADFNIDMNHDHEPDVNVGTVHTSWKPDKDFTHQGFLYDTSTECEPIINIDTNGDDCPDINIDLDNDNKPDLNIDVDGDLIPNTNVDTTGDGNANANIDTNNDGEADENLIDIAEWKPDKKVGNICTMVIKQNTELEDNGIKIEKPDGTPFLPNFALKVEDVTDSKKEEIANDAKDFVKETNEVKKVFDVKLLKDGVEVQPDGILKVKIPYDDIQNPILMRKNANGTYEKIEYKIEDGYLIYETDELGIVSIIGDKESNTSVMGTYTPNIGGAITGDETNTNLYIGISFITLGILSYLLFKKNKQKDTFQ